MCINSTVNCHALHIFIIFILLLCIFIIDIYVFWILKSTYKPDQLNNKLKFSNCNEIRKTSHWCMYIHTEIFQEQSVFCHLSLAGELGRYDLYYCTLVLRCQICRSLYTCGRKYLFSEASCIFKLSCIVLISFIYNFRYVLIFETCWAFLLQSYSQLHALLCPNFAGIY